MIKKKYVGIRVKQLFFFCPILKTILFSLQIFEKFSNTKNVVDIRVKQLFFCPMLTTFLFSL